MKESPALTCPAYDYNEEKSEPRESLPHTLASLRRKARAIEKAARKVSAQAKARAKLIERIEAAKDAEANACRNLSDINDTIRQLYGSRT